MDPLPCLVVLDPSGLTFCDSSGPNLLPRVRLEAEDRSITLRLVCRGATVLRLLRTTGTDSLSTSVTAQGPCRGGQP
ncbi:STAS domain-containing protein [Streptomyces galbus]|uniref:STAS domain-containing protein n=1 Tax=Streptomyces galbus TaxID=33898 RepID=UPI00144AB7B3